MTNSLVISTLKRSEASRQNIKNFDLKREVTVPSPSFNEIRVTNLLVNFPVRITIILLPQNIKDLYFFGKNIIILQ